MITCSEEKVKNYEASYTLSKAVDDGGDVMKRGDGEKESFTTVKPVVLNLAESTIRRYS